MPSNKSEHRRSSKPLMEKRRRARINQSLCELKSFILETAKKENCRRSKLEKADILELTVKHLQNLHKLKNNTVQEETKVTGKFVAGFNQCANEVTKFVSNLEGIDSNVQGRLLSHLKDCLTTIDHNHTNVPDTTTITPSSPPPPPTSSVVVTSTTTPTTRVNLVNGLVTANGDRVALIVQSSDHQQQCTNETVALVHPSTSSSPSAVATATRTVTGGAVLALVPVTQKHSIIAINNDNCQKSTHDHSNVWRPW